MRVAGDINLLHQPSWSFTVLLHVIAVLLPPDTPVLSLI